MTTPTVAVTDNRNLELDRLVKLLQDQSTRKLDVVAGAGAIRAVAGQLVLDGTEPALTADGVTMTSGSYDVNEVADQGLAAKLGIPAAYLRRLHTEHVDLYDANVNGWLSRTDRRFLIRVLRNDSGGGIARAFLSDRYSRIDNIDVLLAALDGIRRAGVPVQVDGCDLTDRRMYVRVYAPQVQALAPTLLKDYRSPFDRRAGSELPVVWAGFVVSNSETGYGKFSITPRLVVQVCRNGMVMGRDAMARTHLGGRIQDDGVVEWSAETDQKNLELITSRTRDAVSAYLDTTYVQRMVRDLEATAGAPVNDPDTTIKVVAQRLKFTDAQAADILSHFILGADLSAGGVMHAITSVAQTVADADTAHELESAAVAGMRIAASL